MFHGHQHNRVGLRLPQFLLDVADGIAKASNTVGQQICEVIGRNDYHTDIDINVAVLEIITDVGIESCLSS